MALLNSITVLNSSAVLDRAAVLCNIQEHKDKVADASAHDEKVEDFMRTEVLVSGIKKRKL